MFNFHPHGESPVAGRNVADARSTDLHQDQPTGPLDGELLDLYAAVLIVVPLAMFLKSVVF